MKGYRIFLGVFLVLLAVYVLAEINRPKPIDWKVTLSKGDKNPYGGYVLFNNLEAIFPSANIASYRTPVYNQLNNSGDYNTAYLLFAESLNLSANDLEELTYYVSEGNYVLMSASQFSKELLDSLKIKTSRNFTSFVTDSASFKFGDSSLLDPVDNIFRKMMLDQYFSGFDTANTIVLDENDLGKASFIEIPYGDGAFFVHANPLVFSNYFMLHRNNASYTAKVFSHLPAEIDYVYWDEFYKLGRGGASTPLRFFLSNDYTRWALRLAVLGMLLYALFEMKRRQRIIPMITPLKNTTLNFIQTIATVYLQQKDNKSLAGKKITYLLEFLRNKYFLATTHLDENFIEQLSRKSGVAKAETEQLVNAIYETQLALQVSDQHLLMLNNHIDKFYKQVQ